MPQGLQIWDANGDKILDTNNQTTSFLGTIPITSVGTISKTDPRLSMGTPFFLLSSMYSGNNIKVVFTPNTITITTSSPNLNVASFNTVALHYGVF